jgi:predicted small integral membrane protein
VLAFADRRYYWNQRSRAKRTVAVLLADEREYCTFYTARQTRTGFIRRVSTCRANRLYLVLEAHRYIPTAGLVRWLVYLPVQPASLLRRMPGAGEPAVCLILWDRLFGTSRKNWL